MAASPQLQHYCFLCEPVLALLLVHCSLSAINPFFSFLSFHTQTKTISMAELFLSAILPALFEKLTSPELLKFATQEGIRSKFYKLKKTLGLINALLVDAEEKQLANRAVKMWLDELQDLAYDAEDVLDEYATKALRRKLKIEEHQASTSKARKLIPACCHGYTPTALWSDFVIRSNIDDITRRLQDLCKQKTELGLVEIAGERSTASFQRPPTTSLRVEPAIFGREEDKAKILKMVLSDEPGHANFGVISIVGMGGIGKTTLAREVYNATTVRDFNPRGWVCVSDDFDVLKISMAILESITGCGSDLQNLDAVQNQLKEKVAGKKFFLVLDDVWNEEYNKWELLRSPFMVADPRSKIIVTTRHEHVALKMGCSTTCTHKLKLLSDDECWSLFEKHAFGNGVVGADASESIREKVIGKCKGLPLVAKTLGGLLLSERRDKWSDILNSKLWELANESEIPAALQISYHHLRPHLKRCFAYCAIFPKDYEFEEKELIFLWMAEGFIQQSSENKSLEDLGDVGDWSMQEFKKVQSLQIQGCKELIELWQNEILLKKSCQWLGSLISLKSLNLDNCDTLTTTLLDGIKQTDVCLEELSISKCNSLNFIFRGELPRSLKKLRITYCEKLEGLLDGNEVAGTSEIEAVNTLTSHIEDLFSERCPSLTCLRSVDQLSRTLTQLSISFCSNLRTLSLTGHLPVALKHLYIYQCSELTTVLPKGHLPETLETLTIWMCRKLESIVDKFHNNNSLFQIHIEDCGKLKSLPEGLDTLTSLRIIIMSCCGGFTSFPKGGFPSSNLGVTLYCCSKVEALPSGIHTLSSLRIYSCRNMSLSEEVLPTKLTRLSIVGHKQYKALIERGLHDFTSLESLEIYGGSDGECIQEEDMAITLLSNLTELSFSELPKLKNLSFKEFQDLSSLKVLRIYNCPELTSLPSLPSSLEQLYINGCPLLKEACKRDKGKEWPKIADIPRVDIDGKFIYDPEAAT